MEIKIYHTLPREAEAIRIAVFVEEQGFCDEMDDTDDIAVHLVMYDGKTPAATCRLFWDEAMQSHLLGRLAVRKEYRGKGAGAAMISRAEAYIKEIGGKSILLHAQCAAAEFYKKQGYQKRGQADDEQGCPHIWMYKELEE